MSTSYEFRSVGFRKDIITTWVISITRKYVIIIPPTREFLQVYVIDRNNNFRLQNRNDDAIYLLIPILSVSLRFSFCIHYYINDNNHGRTTQSHR